MKHGGTGWATYDQVFRRNNTGPDARWDSLDPSLHRLHPGTSGVVDGPLCHLQRGGPHCRTVCTSPDVASHKDSLLPAPHGFATGVVPSLPNQTQGPSQATGGAETDMLSWNKGRCLYPGACSYLHICATCRYSHPARECPHTPPNAGYRQPRPASPLAPEKEQR